VYVPNPSQVDYSPPRCLRFGRQEIVPVYACVFGSTMRGQMRPDSDIDIFVVRSGGAL
jgi:predicted nucleotidyltransferase